MYPSLYRFLFVCIFSYILTVNIQADNREVFDKIVRITNNKGTIYNLLKDISDQSGYLFIYDSQIIENDKIVKIAKGFYTLRDAIYLITGDNQLQIEISDTYILLRIAKKNMLYDKNDSIPLIQPNYFIISGSLFDQQTEYPLIYASVQILNSSIYTITNQDGGFLLKIPDSLLHYKVKFSHIGYESHETTLSLLKNGVINLGMKPQFVALQEVVIIAENPRQLLTEMLNQRILNYDINPVSLTLFYREGIDHNERNIDLTESVLQVYKTGYLNKTEDDQVKLIKKRRILSRLETDSIYPKIRSGIQSCLILDVIKELPDFIMPDNDTPYRYEYKGKNIIDNRPVHVISFQQNDYIREPLYCGELFIETDNKALVEAHLEVNPKHVNKATNTFINKKPFNLIMNLQQAKYIVTYKPSGNGYYYTNHVRGDIHFKIRRKNHLLSTSLHFWIEMVTCDIDTNKVNPIPQNERLTTSRIFSETKSIYDKNFWESLNIILPEKYLKSAIIHNLHEILIPEN